MEGLMNTFARKAKVFCIHAHKNRLKIYSTWMYLTSKIHLTNPITRLRQNATSNPHFFPKIKRNSCISYPSVLPYIVVSSTYQRSLTIRRRAQSNTLENVAHFNLCVCFQRTFLLGFWGLLGKLRSERSMLGFSSLQKPLQNFLHKLPQSLTIWGRKCQ